ncbi:hypothetical protein OR573_05045 [Halomonas sp. CH40]
MTQDSSQTSTSKAAENSNLFISIAAFCDPFLRFTIESLFNQASEPEKLFLGIVDQSHESQQTWISTLAHADQIRYLHIDPLHSKGVSWARHLAQTLYDDEKYFLQIDSHTWFTPNWDGVLRQHMENLQTIHPRPVLSIYPPGFEFDANGQPSQKSNISKSLAIFEVKPDQSLTPDNPVLTFRVTYQPAPQDRRTYYACGFHIAGGFLLTLGHFVREVPYDPQFYFHGEEQHLALRAFTHGWEIFHPSFSEVPLFHLYKQPNTTSSNLHWRQDLDIKRPVKWTQRRASARQRLSKLIDNQLAPPYSLGNARSLDDFILRSGIDYRQHIVQAPITSLVKVPEPI